MSENQTKKPEPKPIAINKYSIYELKSAVDTKIIEVILYNVISNFSF